ncbi:MAG: ROK family protein, partial [Solirubrobacterales bacterium]
LSQRRLSEPCLTETQLDDVEALLAEIVDSVEQVRGDGIEAVGVGIPGPVEFETGRLRSAPNLPLHDMPLRKVLSKRIGLPVYVDNDATVAALAEASDGDRIAVRNLVMFTVGTGVGGGLVLRGRVYRGATGAAGELGQTLIGADLVSGAPEPGHYPRPGSLETLAAGTALDRLVAELAASEPGSALGRRAAEQGHVEGPDAVELAKQGDEGARRVIRVLGERLGIGIANAINTFDPDEIVIGGGVSAAGDLLLEPARKTARDFALTGVGTETKIRLARHGPRAGVLGAALLGHLELEAERSESGAGGES